ncbi:hypothetical protein S83_012849, partial [Arachis hypogaea]
HIHRIFLNPQAHAVCGSSSSAAVHPRHLPPRHSTSTPPSSFSALIHNAAFLFLDAHLRRRLPPPRRRSSTSA